MVRLILNGVWGALSLLSQFQFSLFTFILILILILLILIDPSDQRSVSVSFSYSLRDDSKPRRVPLHKRIAQTLYISTKLSSGSPDDLFFISAYLRPKVLRRSL